MKKENFGRVEAKIICETIKWKKIRQEISLN